MDSEKMRIVSWNCNGAFRKKFKILLSQTDADILVIQECENPNQLESQEYKEFSRKFFWKGHNKNKGLGIFIINQVGIEAEKNQWEEDGLRNFISIKINSHFDLLGVWACNPYIKEYMKYQENNYKYYQENMIIVGDFNSNSCWDKGQELYDHSQMVKKLSQKNLISAYHYKTQEQQGCETQKTFFMHKNPEKPYHIDYCFLKEDRLKKFKILKKEQWLTYSDHMPLVVDVKE